MVYVSALDGQKQEKKFLERSAAGGGAKANQVEPFAYVRDLLSQLPGRSPPAVAILLRVA